MAVLGVDDNLHDEPPGQVVGEGIEIRETVGGWR